MIARLLLVIATVAGIGLAACGDGGDTGSSGGPTGATGAAGAASTPDDCVDAWQQYGVTLSGANAQTFSDLLGYSGPAPARVVKYDSSAVSSPRLSQYVEDGACFVVTNIQGTQFAFIRSSDLREDATAPGSTVPGYVMYPYTCCSRNELYPPGDPVYAARVLPNLQLDYQGASGD